jgi:hypothetical protein
MHDSCAENYISNRAKRNNQIRYVFLYPMGAQVRDPREEEAAKN